MHLLAAFTDGGLPEEALSSFMQVNGTALTSALAPFPRGVEGWGCIPHVTQYPSSPAGNNHA